MIVVLVAPAIGLALAGLLYRSTPTALDPIVEPVVVRPAEVMLTGEQTVSISVRYEPERPIFAPDWTGVITALFFERGDVLVSGDLFGIVDREPVVAVHTDRPFTRPLAAGDQGDDVVMLQTFLAEAGMFGGDVSGLYDEATAAAVRTWRASVDDVELADRFDPSSVVWLPAEELRLASLLLEVGGIAPSQGSVIAAADSPPSGAIVLDTNDTPVEVSAERHVILAGDVLLGDLRGPEITGATLSRLLDSLESGTVRAVDDGQSLPPSVDGSRELRIAGLVRLAVSARALALPSSALVGRPGAQCIWLAGEPRFRALPVSVLSGGVGFVYLDPVSGLDPDVEVVANPADVVRRPCK